MFSDYVKKCKSIKERDCSFICQRLQGQTLEAIGKEYGLTRERVRQVVKKVIAKVKAECLKDYGTETFDEDYYRYLFEKYSFDKKDAADWLGLSEEIWNYLDLTESKMGTDDLINAVEDVRNLNAGLRIKIRNFLNSKRVLIQGVWVEKNRLLLEKIAAKNICSDACSFNVFFNSFNGFLQSLEIPYDINIYYSDDLCVTRKHHLSGCDYILWSQNEQMRYYDIKKRDYTELFETLNLDSYSNTQLSTAKFMSMYPELMKRYDIRDAGELHNLLRKTVKEGSYNDIHFDKMPIITFGEFDRDSAFFDMMVENAPLSMNELAELIHQEFGFETATVLGSYLTNLKEYYSNGAYRIDQKTMLGSRRDALNKVLINDMYFIDEIKKIYLDLYPEADAEEVNSYTLKNMGFQVYSNYILRNYATLDDFFIDLFAKNDTFDLGVYRKRYGYRFNPVLRDLKSKGQIIEFEPNQYITLNKLEESGIKKEDISDFQDEIYSYVDDLSYFTIQSLRIQGFSHKIFDFGFSDFFYSNLIALDNRFSYGYAFGPKLFCKGGKDIFFVDFVIDLIGKYGKIDSYDLLTELQETYGCLGVKRYDLVNSLKGSIVYYDKILDRFYADEETYYKELDQMGDEWT